MKKNLCLLLSFYLLIFNIVAQDDKIKKDSITLQSFEGNLNESISEGQDDEDGNNYFVPGLLHSSQDVFMNNTFYAFSIAYFKTRGLDSRYQTTAINGFMMNNLVTERASYSQWGGLNNVVRFPENVLGLNPATFTFGSIGGSLNYNLRASAYGKQFRATYSLSNRTYTNRLMFTYATGVSKRGWAFATSVSARFGNQLSYVDGTSYNGISYFLAAEKQFNRQHALNFTVFGAPVQRGMQANSVQEVYDLLDNHYYNPNWGWYNGKQRNARIRTIHEPVILLSHYFTPENHRYLITTTLTSTFGKNTTTSLNWNDVPDPRPDYYRYLPSYQTDTMLKNFITEQWLTNADYRQIDWNNMYEINQLAAVQGKQAQYMIENRNISHLQIGGASNLVADLTEHIKLSAGLDVRGLKQNNNKTIGDLLGGLYWLDVDKYSEGDFPDDANVIYNDLDNKDVKLYEGDIFSYNYDYYIYTQLLWGMLNFSYKQVDFHAGLNVGGTEFWREGYMKNGRFPEDSKGKSDVKSFLTYGVKAGVTYKINGRNYLVLNGQYSSEAPSILNAFVAPRIRNTYVSNLKNENIAAADFSYILNYPVIKMRLTGYFAKIMNQTRLISFYHDDYASMVNYSMSGIDQQHIGLEFGSEIKLGSMFSLILAGNWGDYIYTNRPKVVINAENGYDILANSNSEASQEIYWKNFHVAGSPQAAATAGLKFNHNYWYVNLNVNYFDKIYCDLNPERRTSTARGTLEETDPIYQKIIEQERLKGQFTIDVSLSKSWRIDKYTIGFNLSITNLLNNKNLITTAWEQYRFDYNEYNVNKFQNKYYYAFGTTVYAGVNFRF